MSSTKAAQALKKQADEQILNASIRERVAIRVGFPRLFAVLLPSASVVTWQTIELIKSMFELTYFDHWIVFTIGGILSILSLLFLGVQVINAKSEEIYNQRQAEFVGLYNEGKKKKISTDSGNDEDSHFAEENESKKQKILNEINKEATFFGLWLSNLSHLASFVFFSFVVFRFFPTPWNFLLSVIGAVIVSQYLPFQLVNEPSYNFE